MIGVSITMILLPGQELRGGGGLVAIVSWYTGISYSYCRMIYMILSSGTRKTFRGGNLKQSCKEAAIVRHSRVYTKETMIRNEICD